MMIFLVMSVKSNSKIYQSGTYYSQVYFPNSMTLKLSKLWMTRYYKIICHIFPKFTQFKKNTILEIGSGYGGFINLLHNLGYKKITASDICNNIYHTDPNYKFKIFNIEKENTQSKYDAILCLDVMEHINNTDLAINNIKKSLNKKGVKA